MKAAAEALGTLLAAGLVIAVTFGPWIVHIVWCIRAAAETGSAIALLLVGLVIPPIGWIHGVCLLLGFTWI